MTSSVLWTYSCRGTGIIVQAHQRGYTEWTTSEMVFEGCIGFGQASKEKNILDKWKRMYVGNEALNVY